MIPIVLLWVFLAMIIGFLGRNFRFGFWGYFFASVLFTPIIGVLMLVAAVPLRHARHQPKVVKRT
jgi:hypothetical protein